MYCELLYNFLQGLTCVPDDHKASGSHDGEKNLFEIRYSKSFDSASYYNVASSSLPSAGA